MAFSVFAQYLANQSNNSLTLCIRSTSPAAKTYPHFLSHFSSLHLTNPVPSCIPSPSPPPLQPTIVIGMRGSGKSTLCENYSKLYNPVYIDLDSLVLSAMGVSSLQPEQLALFRSTETRLLLASLRAHHGDSNVIISTGGGIVCS